jgi:hypothetical protein
MLEKIPGLPRINKLRISQILEADLNQVLRSEFARNISKLAQETPGIISEHQYGRSHQKYLTPILNKLLTVQLLIQKKTNGIVFDNDAKGCYNRIVSGIALAALRRIGYSKNSVRMLGLLWAQLEHHVATWFGLSDTSYKSTLEKLLYGIIQGSCSSPIVCALLNQLLLTALGEEFDCISLVSFDSKTTDTRPGDSFVDDTTTGATYDNHNLEPIPSSVSGLTQEEEILVARTEDIIQFFFDLLQVTGGDLALEKCAWCLIGHRWRKGVPTLIQIEPQHLSISMTSMSSGQVSGINRKAPTEGHRTLGFFMTGDGTSNEHKRVMMKKGLDYATAIKNSTLPCGECSMAYSANYMPILAYGTPSTTLSYKECEDFQRAMVAAILPKMGIVRNAARKVIFGSAKYCGLGPDHLATAQNLLRLQYLIGHIRSKSITSKLIRQQLDYTQLEIGCPSHVLGQD